MPLLIAPEGKSWRVVHLSADSKVRRRLESLGIVEKAEIKVLSHNPHGIILAVGNSKLALDEETASHIHVA